MEMKWKSQKLTSKSFSWTQAT
jgi:hypothetical protein